MNRLMLPALMIMTACATPQQQCVNNVTRNIQTLDALIAESEANIARGFGYQDSVTFVPQWQVCGWGGVGNSMQVTTQMCWVDQPISSRRPVAIDLNAEQAKLNGLRKKRAQQAQAAGPAIAQCQAQFPQ